MTVLSFGNSLKQFGFKKEAEEEENGILIEDNKTKEAVTVCKVKGEEPPENQLPPSRSPVRSPKKIKRSIAESINDQVSDPSLKATSPRSRSKRDEKLILDEIKDKRLVPLLRPGLRCVFVGFNPGTESALKGHYYAHRSNLFWKLIYESGCVNRPVTYIDDTLLPDEFDIGFTDLVGRPTPGIKQLSGQEMIQGAPILEQKIAKHKPYYVCLVGKGIWEAVYRYKRGNKLPESFQWGLQAEKLGGSNIYVVPSTSGLAASISRETKLKVWKVLAGLINDPVVTASLVSSEPGTCDETNNDKSSLK
ncbi:hypothetical protein AWJ20_1623 [Sugiyamaella lignohabitans]|uniref:Uracil-DNA glycosylase-like domain-containing protein n=1 Tax=Sugiyamaella lignohabitans TaxID=796027 RepID=A0A161HK84_9ASCO|nr:uncharacterized protein AWJ20_1623 [Sugiyamaella lignohabitans]ANB13337.1 hypothetical protein AWJ20_1623 [Sugiyamaella lignohabitans]